MVTLTFQETELTLNESHIGTRLTINRHQALVQALDDKVVAVYRTEISQRSAIGVVTTPLMSNQKVNGVPIYEASVGYFYQGDPKYSALDALLVQESM